jgi:hypothetical protein
MHFAKCIFEGCPQYDKCGRAQDATAGAVNYAVHCNDGNCFKWMSEREAGLVTKDESVDKKEES